VCLSIECWRECALQAGIQVAPADQLFVCALILDHALIQNDNSIHPLERGAPV